MNVAGMLWSVLFSSIGLGYFIYGRRQKAPVAFICGLLLMGYSYFFDNAFVIVAIGGILMAVPYFIRL